MRRPAEAEHERQGATDGVVVEFGDERAALRAAADAKQAQFFERTIGLADRHAARLELARHVAFGRQFVAGREASVRDLLLDAAGDRVGNPMSAS